MDAEPTAQELFRHMWHDLLGPALRELGFRGGGSRPYFWYPGREYRAALTLWKNRHSTRQEVDFTGSLIAWHVPSDSVYWENGLDDLVPGVRGPRRTIQADHPVEPVADAVLATIRSLVWPAIQAALDSPGYPPDPSRKWQREFPLEPENDHHKIPAYLDGVARAALAGYPADGTFARLAEPFVPSRASAVARVGSHERDDPRTLPALLDRLEHDPAWQVRRNAALVLFPSAADQGEVREALQAAAEQDEDVQVRWAARFSLRRAALASPST